MLTEAQKRAILSGAATEYPAWRLPGPRKKYTTAERKKQKARRKEAQASRKRNRRRRKRGHK